MKRRLLWLTLGLPSLSLVVFVACANSDDPPATPQDDGGSETSLPDSGSDAADASDGSRDAEVLRCSGEFCLVDVPNSRAYGFTKWVFTGLQVDPVIGAWAIANGVQDQDVATAQILHYEGDAWKPVHAPTLGGGADKRSIRLLSLASDGAGKLLAVGVTIDDGSAVLVRGDGTTFTTSAFTGSPTAAWFAEAGKPWLAGRGGSLFEPLPDGGFRRLPTVDPEVDFASVWGTGPRDLYFGGIKGVEEWDKIGFLAHRTVNDAGAPTIKTRVFYDLQTYPSREHTITAGVAQADGDRFLAASDMVARWSVDGGDGGPDWIADPTAPPVSFRAFWARAKNDIWASANVGRIYHFDGTGWKDSLLVFNGAPLTSNLTGISGTSAGEIFVVGDGVALRRKP